MTHGFDAEAFRADARAATDWVESFLERLPELPVFPRVAPGDIRALR